MTTLNAYQQFEGRHPETGTLCNALAYQGRPLSEALLLGVSGGAAFMVFLFDYEGYTPHIALGTRYPFDAFDAAVERLRLNAARFETTSPAKAAAQLEAALAAGKPAIVWADRRSLPYSALPADEFPYVQPLLVYGCDEATGVVQIADRARAPLTCTPAELAAARARQGSLKHRLITLAPPDHYDLLPAVEAGLRACAGLLLDKPPKGPAANFGLAGLQKWARLLTDPKDKAGWRVKLPASEALYNALIHVFEAIVILSGDGGAARWDYADFLDEASALLDRPELRTIAAQFRASAALWRELADAALPESTPALRQTRDLLTEREKRYLTEGSASVERRQQITAELSRLAQAVGAAFPLTQTEIEALLADLAARVRAIHDIEREAALALQAAL